MHASGRLLRHFILRPLIMVAARAMGLLGRKAENTDTARRVNLDYTVAAAEAFDQVLASRPSERGNSNFRFLYLSGDMAVRDQKSSPWFLGDSRRMRVLLLCSLWY